MKRQIVNAKIVLSNGVLEGGVLAFENGVITHIGKERTEADETLDLGGKYLVPGFIDLHCHGGNGLDFMDATAEEMTEIARFHLSHGTTGLYATTMTDTEENIQKALDTYATIKDKSTLLGAHLEGPWFNHLQCGAQATDTMQLPSVDKLQAWVTKYPFIKRVSVAPELPQGMQVGKAGQELGVVMSIGHTDADFDAVLSASENGYSLVTLLYSAMKGVERKNAFRI